MGREKGTPLSVSRWLNACSVDEEDYFVLSASLMPQPQPVQRFGAEQMADPMELARSIIDIAQIDCNEREQRQSYTLQHCREHHGPLCTTVLKLKPVIEAPTWEGGDMQSIVRQTLEHNESMMRMMMDSHKGTLGMLAQMNDRLYKRIEKLEANQSRVLEMEADALRSLALTDQDSELAEAKLEGLKKLMDVGEQFAPVIAQKLLAASSGGKDAN